LGALAALRQQLEAQLNDEKNDSLENLVPHINVPTEFNQDTSESARERHNYMQRERRAKQPIESTEPSKMPQERNNHLHQKWRTV
jgi:hypothetical protein